jgi:hypothetical protein
MSGNSHTSIRSRQDAAELRTLREQAVLSGAEVAKRLSMSPSKISRIETGNSACKSRTSRHYWTLYQAPASPRGRAARLGPSLQGVVPGVSGALWVAVAPTFSLDGPKIDS